MRKEFAITTKKTLIILMQTHARKCLLSSTFLHFYFFSFSYCTPAELEMCSVPHYDMGLKKINSSNGSHCFVVEMLLILFSP